MTDRVTKPRQRKKKEKPAVAVREAISGKQSTRKLERPTTPITPTFMPANVPFQVVVSPNQKVLASLNASIEDEANNALTNIRAQHKLPMLYQPSLADAFDGAFISHFVQLNKGVRASNPESQWLTHLPGLSTTAYSRALKLSLRAASMAFYARVHSDAPILVDSYRWYTVSLNSQRMALSKLQGVNGYQIPRSALSPL